MAKMKPFVDIADVAEKMSKYAKFIETTPVVFERTLSDMYSRAPGVVASAVESVYNIKKSEIKYKKGETFCKTKIGSIRGKGDTVMSFELDYEGRVLTPLHFGMTPKNYKSIAKKPFKGPKKKKVRKQYEVGAEIKKGKQITFSRKNGGVFFAPAGGNGTIIPWFRNSSVRDDIFPIITLSLPEMIGPNPKSGKGGNPVVMETYSKGLSELLDKRYHNHLKQHRNKTLK